MTLRGILLAGGEGTRLHPVTRAVSKHLLPIYDKPLVHYPLSVLLLAGVRDVLVITTPRDQAAYQTLLGDGSDLGIALAWAVQPRAEGIAQALLLGRSFLAGGRAALILGDNVFHGPGLEDVLARAAGRREGATVFACAVRDPQRYGVVVWDADGLPVDIVEKPAVPPSRHAVTGLYLYDEHAPEIAAALRPSARGELEITDVNRAYLRAGALHVERLPRGIAWLDTGTPDALLQAGAYIQTLQTREGRKVACVEEIAWRKGFIGDEDLERLAARWAGTEHGRYLAALLAEGP